MEEARAEQALRIAAKAKATEEDEEEAESPPGMVYNGNEPDFDAEQPREWSRTSSSKCRPLHAAVLYVGDVTPGSSPGHRPKCDLGNGFEVSRKLVSEYGPRLASRFVGALTLKRRSPSSNNLSAATGPRQASSLMTRSSWESSSVASRMIP